MCNRTGTETLAAGPRTTANSNDFILTGIDQAIEDVFLMSYREIAICLKSRPI